MTPDEIAALPYRKNAGVVLVNKDGLIFGGKRIDNPGNAWQMPQGGIDKGEDAREAGLRELEEETGVSRDLVTVEAETANWLTYDLPDDLIPTIWKGKYRGQKQRWYLMRFHGQDSDIDISKEHPEFSEWQWMTPNALIDSIVPFKRDIYINIFDEFATVLRG